MTLKIIADIRTDFPEKFGIPRQSGLIEGLRGRIIFRPEFRTPDAVRGIEGFSHLWLMWGFSKVTRSGWSATVAPPRLGGKKKMGVFATRSPFRPNPIGLSSVKLDRVEFDERLGPILHVSGIDMLDGTPIYDIKPYLPFTDSHPDAIGGFADEVREYGLKVNFSLHLFEKIPESKRDALITILENDPRPSYKDDGDHEYGMVYADLDIFFKVESGTLTVTRIESKK